MVDGTIAFGLYHSANSSHPNYPKDNPVTKACRLPYSSTQLLYHNKTQRN